MYWIPIDANFYQVVDFQKAKKQIDLCLIFRLVDVHILNFYSLFENLFCTKVLTDIFAIWCVKNQSQLELADELIDTSVEKSNKKNLNISLGDIIQSTHFMKYAVLIG